jgi:hypothetical protein
MPMPEKEEIGKLANNAMSVARSTISVIDAIVQRGGFRGEEILTIGQLRDQCSQLIEAAENVNFDLDEDE